LIGSLIDVLHAQIVTIHNTSGVQAISTRESVSISKGIELLKLLYIVP
jgi:hypothetical protein